MFKHSGYMLLLLFFITACDSDDEMVATCNTITNIASSAITNTSATLTWEDSNVNSTLIYQVEYGISGFILGNGTSISVSETTINLTGLNANTTYDIYIQTICSATNVSMYTDAYSLTTNLPFPIPEFKTVLSDLNVYVGHLSNLQISPYAFEYDLHSRLFSDYATKQRFFILPIGETLVYNGDGLPIFPNNSIIVKTFFYNIDDRAPALGQQIIETRLLIKINGSWETGDYKWNDEQTEATLDLNGSIVPVNWIDSDGDTRSVDYEIPSNTDCFTCHQSSGTMTPIGPKMRNINFNFNGSNQIQTLINSNVITGITDPATVSLLPKWDDLLAPLDARARAYMDINCAHCHRQGGSCEEVSDLRLDYETPYIESLISQRRNSILTRIQNTIPEYGMPLIGTTILHEEGIDLLIEYINTLD